MQENRKKSVVMMRAACVLLILVLLTTSVISERYARYSASVTDSDSFRVARFSVVEEGNLQTTMEVTLSPDSEAIQKSIQVTNDSEVTVEYILTAENPYRNLPLEFVFYEEDTEITQVVLQPGQSRQLELQISWQAGKVQDTYMGKVDLVVVTLKAVQLD